MKNIDARLKVLQPNSQQREEMLVVIDYLLENAFDEDNAVQAIKIVEYAKEKHQLYLRRDRVTQILIHLHQLTEDNSFNLPFKIGVKELKKGFKFYISKRLYTQKELLDIISAIKNDPSKSETVANNLINKILNNNVSKQQNSKYLEMIKNRDRKVIKSFSTNGYNSFISLIEEICDKKDIITFKIMSADGIGFFKKIPNIKDTTLKHRGIINRIIDVRGSLKLLIYLYEDKNAIIVPVENISIIEKRSNKKKVQISYSLLKNNKEIEISEWVSEFYSGKTGDLVNFKIRLSTQDKDTYNRMRKLFNKYWKNTNYEVSQLVDPASSIKYEYITFKSNSESFLNWYKDIEIMLNFTIVKPASFNDQIFRGLIYNFQEKLNQFGQVYELYSNETIKKND